MKEVTVNILKSDFEDNQFMNFAVGLEGCPMERALFRAGVITESSSGSDRIGWNFLREISSDDGTKFSDASTRICGMFGIKETPEDFSFTISVPDQWLRN